MASPNSHLSTNVVLIMVLMSIAIVCLGALSFDYHRKILKLRSDVKRLESTQIMLMVPDEQAQAIADWLASHPEQTKAMLKMAEPGVQTAVTLGPQAAFSSAEVPSLLDRASNGNAKAQAQMDSVPDALRSETAPSVSRDSVQPLDNAPVVISENADGVKVISLPNGGIRVTTREGE